MKRVLLGVLLGCLYALPGCGDSPTVDPDADDKSNTKKHQAPDGGASSGSSGQNQNSEDVLTGDPDGKCTPTTCKAQHANCGVIADGCGKSLECGECESGAKCSIVDVNQCTVLKDLCKPLSKDDACKGKECGVEGDGCGGTFECGTCAEGQACGQKDPFQCGKIPASTDENCAAKIDSCKSVNVSCGKISNGCGGIIDCDEETGGCKDGLACNAKNVCAEPTACEPIAKADACDGRCGVVSNGCGVEVNDGVIECPACPDGQACGAGGVANKCGSADDACQKIAKADACGDKECGAASDGCAGSYSCGTCGDGEVCRAGVCEATCTPSDKATACGDKECGFVSDLCGGVYECGTCADAETCGLQEAFQCAATPPTECVPREAAAACEGKECGVVFDGCGTEAANMIDCGNLGDAGSNGCADGEFCGVVTPYQCDGADAVQPNCTPATSCADLGWECGIAIDDCGNVFDCSTEGRSCDAMTETCIGGIDGPTQCLSGTGGGGSNTADCEVCDAIPDCRGQSQVTKLTGRVITPGKSDNDTNNQVGVPNAFVYILQTLDEDDMPDMTTGIPEDGTSCDRCADQDLGPVLASATTDAFGEYTIEGNIPVDQEFILAVKIGKFRRAERITIPANSACQTYAVDPLKTRLARSSSDGLRAHLPHVAVSTGELDAMECVFYKMGITSDEFAEPGDNGDASQRFHLYGTDGAAASTGDTPESDLFSTLDRLLTYDMIVFDCQGPGYPDYDSSDPRVREYVNRGGRMFASHLSYTWIYDNGNGAYDSNSPYTTGLAPAANWSTSDPHPTSGTGFVSVGRTGANTAKIQRFADWLEHEGAATLTGGKYQFTISDPRDNATSVNASSEEFVYRSTGNSTTSVQQFAFNTPYGAPADAICGRVAYSGFHVVATGGSYKNSVFPNHCTGDLSAQEKTLLYMLFDLGACVTTDIPEPPTCTPVSDCTGRCGTLPNGCGGVLSCTCGADQICLAGGVCGVPQCVKTTCQAEGATCGVMADGCGGVLDCGDCPEGQACGIVSANQCTQTCTPNDEEMACDGVCGFVSDGCGGVHQCPGCDGSLSCIAGACTDQGCEPNKDCPAEYECGRISDGCDGFLDCGSCELPEVCGGGGEANKCGKPSCPALTCDDLGADCGWVGDGCGAALDCGDCPSGQVCGSNGHPNECVGCKPRTCDDAGAECGYIGDGCGALINCGGCDSGESCGAEAANRCGPPTGNCPPLTCHAAGAECGLIGDGCGGQVDCGQCPKGQVCGIDTPFQCGDPPTCTATTCDAEGAECGSIGDGCGGLLNCGACPAGQSCGLKSPNQCDSLAGVK
jgi:hypothetical protein